jgi:hypothetical protein
MRTQLTHAERGTILRLRVHDQPETAEETLLIAARLQHVERERLSLSELKRTAAEPDISPEFVDEAIRIMGERKTPVTKTSPTTAKDRSLILGLVVLQCAVFLGLAWAPADWSVPFWLPAIAICGAAGYLTRRRRRISKIVLFSVLRSLILLSLGSLSARYASGWCLVPSCT